MNDLIKIDDEPYLVRGLYLQASGETLRELIDGAQVLEIDESGETQLGASIFDYDEDVLTMALTTIITRYNRARGKTLALEDLKDYLGEE